MGELWERNMGGNWRKKYGGNLRKKYGEHLRKKNVESWPVRVVAIMLIAWRAQFPDSTTPEGPLLLSTYTTSKTKHARNLPETNYFVKFSLQFRTSNLMKITLDAKIRKLFWISPKEKNAKTIKFALKFPGDCNKCQNFKN